MLIRRKERLEEEVKSGKRGEDERERTERKQRETDRGVKTMFIACAWDEVWKVDGWKNCGTPACNTQTIGDYDSKQTD